MTSSKGDVKAACGRGKAGGGGRNNKKEPTKHPHFPGRKSTKSQERKKGEGIPKAITKVQSEVNHILIGGDQQEVLKEGLSGKGGNVTWGQRGTGIGEKLGKAARGAHHLGRGIPLGGAEKECRKSLRVRHEARNFTRGRWLEAEERKESSTRSQGGRR